MQLLFATTNKGKRAELAALCRDAGYDVIGPDDTRGLPEVEETGSSFAENALLKARAAFEATGLTAIADDSGLVVPALGGRPGVLSARYAGGGGDVANLRKLAGEVAGIAPGDRRAFFTCALALVGSATSSAKPEDKRFGAPERVFEGQVWGHLLVEPRGSGGFGYDPIFFHEPSGQTFAELDAKTKNGLSHRGQAFAALVRYLRTVR